MKRRIGLIIFLSSFLFVLSCKNTPTETPPTIDGCELNDINENTEVEGYDILTKLPGIWNGPVTSPTPIGSFPEWIVDFRPNSSSQVSAKNELNKANDIFMSFFIVKYDCGYKMAFRNGGTFSGNVRNSYMIIDSVDVNYWSSFFRFVDPISGGNRVYTDILFKQDSLIMHTYTNKFGILSEPVTHMIWRAKLVDETSTENAIKKYNYPQKKMVKDFSTTFNGLTDAVFYSNASDPFPENEQPNLGVSTINIKITNPVVIDTAKKILIIITTQPLFDGFNFNPQNLNYRSRYVFINAATNSDFDFNYMHAGKYYLNAVYDETGDLNFSTGDYINSPFDIPFTLSESASANATINFKIP